MYLTVCPIPTADLCLPKVEKNGTTYRKKEDTDRIFLSNPRFFFHVPTGRRATGRRAKAQQKSAATGDETGLVRRGLQKPFVTVQKRDVLGFSRIFLRVKTEVQRVSSTIVLLFLALE